MRKAVSIIFRKLTTNEFKAITNTINSDGGGSQTYIDFPKGSVSDEQMQAFFNHTGEPIDNGFEWKFKVNSLSLGQNQQNATISARRTSSNSLREQNKEKRIEIWKDSISDFPQSGYNETENPIVVFIVKDDTNEYWAGWFFRNRCTDSWYMTKGLSTVIWKDCGYVKFDMPIPFVDYIYEWPFGWDHSITTRLNNTNLGRNNYLAAIRTKPFVLLAGISGTGKSRIVRKLAQATDDIDKFENEEARWNCNKPANFALIQVKPNWHNSMDVVGYKSNIGNPHYEFTPFVEFVAKAWLHPETPFFLCLDEMNLAPVEEYFAEYLSAIESRSINEHGNYETDPIIKPFKEFGDQLGKEMATKLASELSENGKIQTTNKELENQLLNKGLSLPQNLIVMGTVNMDDTTFSFSRKVLDRAMSIEMNEVDYEAFLNGTSEIDIPVLTEDNALLINRPIKAKSVKEEVDAEKIIRYLTDVNALLDGTPFKLGYRAANEAILYAAACKAWGNDSIETALDQFSLMKILSRIEGDESKLTIERDGKTTDIISCMKEVITQHLGQKEDGKWQSVKKLDEMSATLRRDHFVSYWT